MRRNNYKKNYLEYFIEMLVAERGATQNTMVSYKKDIEDLYNHLEVQNKELNEVTNSVLTNFISELSKKGLGAKTVGRKISTYRQFFAFLISEGFMEHNPALNLIMPKKLQSIPRPLSENTLQKLIEVSTQDNSKEGIRTNAMLEILYSTGMRISELVTLEMKSLENFSVDSNTNFLIIKGKGNKERAVILNEFSTIALKKYLETKKLFLKDGAKANWLFPSYAKDGRITHITRQRFGQILKELAKIAGVEHSDVSPHKIRHSFATHMLQNGANLRVVQELLGHSDISSTQIYTHVSDKRARKLLLDKHPIANKEIDEEKK
ncbi:site-specific tyrosine recombinase XerD [Candidatus Bandiella euplotis]|uniref:Tyrosine recombinase XerD n=1 Tax=Candidatus Bandiella euplotis TaxID=1664265 RepID=A0ABZ0UIQ7_9RICK|nr:site-specific tyrosine recombinase XerD [Candidatus Bandiella woodruffii]WPX95964.1 Tyrosine recombinase XerD [Candidatus Bandiella woodruffii]